MPPDKTKFLKEEIAKFLELGIIEEAWSNGNAVLFCARQSVAMIGHRESKHAANDDGMNHGNYTELCDLLELENP